MIMKKLAVRIVCIAVLLLGGGCTSIFRIDGPYKGKVVDCDNYLYKQLTLTDDVVVRK